MRFFTSDLHFGHARIQEFCPGRNVLGETVEEMNQGLIDNWNSVVSEGDEVYILGDLAMGKIRETLPLVSRLNGTKFLVSGNHDRCWIGNKDASRWTDFYEAQGLMVVSEQLTVEVPLPSGAIMPVFLCHFPYEGDSGREDRYPEYRIPLSTRPLLHGHVHDEWQIKGNQFNVGVDANDYFPVSEHVIGEWLASLNPV